MTREFLTILFGLAFGGASFVYGGHSLKPEYRVWTILSYCVGTACLAAALILAVIYASPDTEPAPAATANLNENHPVVQPMVKPVAEPAGTSTPQRPQAPQAANVTPHELANIARNHTSAQIQRLVQPYIGKLMVVPGIVADVKSSLYQDEPVIMFSDGNDHFGVMMRFPREMRERVLSLNEGDSIVVTGRIESIDGWGLLLADCDFKFVKSKDQQPIESTAAAAKPTTQPTPAPALVHATPEQLVSRPAINMHNYCLHIRRRFHLRRDADGDWATQDEAGVER